MSGGLQVDNPHSVYCADMQGSPRPTRFQRPLLWRSDAERSTIAVTGHRNHWTGGSAATFAIQRPAVPNPFLQAQFLALASVSPTRNAGLIRRANQPAQTLVQCSFLGSRSCGAGRGARPQSISREPPTVARLLLGSAHIQARCPKQGMLRQTQ